MVSQIVFSICYPERLSHFELTICLCLVFLTSTHTCAHVCTCIQQVHVYKTSPRTHRTQRTLTMSYWSVFPLSERKASINPVIKKTTLIKPILPHLQSSFSLSAVRSSEQRSYSLLATPPSLALLFLSLLLFFPSLRRCPWLCFVPVSLCQVTSLILRAIRVQASNVYEAGMSHIHTVKHTQTIALIP